MNTPKSTCSTTPTAASRRTVRSLNLPYVPFQYDTFEETDSEEEREMAKAAEYMARRQQQDADMSQDWPIHRGFLIYTLEDVAHENSKETLMQ